MEDTDRTEEQLAELLGELPPVPEAWVQAARAIGTAPPVEAAAPATDRSPAPRRR